MKSSAIACLISLSVLGAMPGQANAQSAPSRCGELTNGIGPFDYRVDKQHLPIVEGAHFTPEVEMLVKGKGGYLGQDLDYTLRAFPNHHRALISVMRYGERLKSPQPGHVRYTVECYFERATRFRPDDAVSRMLFAQFLYKESKPEAARAQLEVAAHGGRENAFTLYNIGLVYAEAKDYARALENAHKAYGMGITRPGLREQLAAAGQWKDAEPAPAVVAAPPSAAEPTAPGTRP